MKGSQQDRILTSVLWGGVAAAGQYTALFLTIIRRIHVRFAPGVITGESVGPPRFDVDPRGPIALTKDSALASVWILTVVYALLVAGAVYARPRPQRSVWLVFAFVTVALAAVAALAEPLWGLVVLADGLALCPALIGSKARSTGAA
jgi:hypothetical protein